MPESHLCKNCFFNKMQNAPEKGENYCNLFVKRCAPDPTSCINYALAQDVASTIIQNKVFSKEVKTSLVYSIITKKLEKKDLTAISEAVVQTNEIADFEIKFVEMCKDYLQKHYRKTKKINKKITSYRLKHIIEKAIGNYISNGEVIAAAADLGYDVDSDGICPNAMFNIEEYDPFDDWLSRKNV